MIMFIAVFVGLVMWHLLPVLLGSAVADICSFLLTIGKTFRKVLGFILKAQWYSITSAYNDCLAGMKWWGSNAKKGYSQANQKRAQKSESKERKAQAKNAHAVRLTVDAQLDQFTDQLSQIRESVQVDRDYLAELKSKDEADREFEKPAYLRKMLFQTTPKGQIILDKKGYAKRFTVAGMFKTTESSKPEIIDAEETPKPTVEKPKSKVRRTTTKPPRKTSNWTPDLDNDGYEPDLDPALYV